MAAAFPISKARMTGRKSAPRSVRRCKREGMGGALTRAGVARVQARHGVRLEPVAQFSLLVQGSSNKDCHVERTQKGSRPKSSREGSVFDDECCDIA